MHPNLSETDRNAIQEAVERAEKRTSGEIVPFVVGRSSVYPIAFWKAACLFGLTGLILVFVLSMTYTGFGLGWLFSAAGHVVAVIVSAVIGLLLVRFIPGLHRLLVGPAALAAAVRDRASRAFLEEEVFNTRERTGILLLVSLFEHRVEVVGDSGINDRVDPEDWGSVIEDILKGIKAGKLSDGFVSAIERCGRLLEAKGVEIREDDTDELSDSVRVEEQ